MSEIILPSFVLFSLREKNSVIVVVYLYASFFLFLSAKYQEALSQISSVCFCFLSNHGGHGISVCLHSHPIAAQVASGAKLRTWASS